MAKCWIILCNKKSVMKNFSLINTWMTLAVNMINSHSKKKKKKKPFLKIYKFQLVKLYQIELNNSNILWIKQLYKS